LNGVHPNPLTIDEANNLVTACNSLKWIDEKSAYLLAGWIAIARIAGALPVRPHIWLTGGAGTGKSTVMDNLIRPALGGEHGRFYLQGGSTEAGIRQMIKADSIPIIFDEFETTNESSKNRVESIVELLRQSWSYTQGHIVKGSASGEAQQYALGFSALVSSIRVSLNNDADRSRFSVLELDKHGSDQKQWTEARSRMLKMTEEFGERLFARSVKNMDSILKSYSVFKSELANIVSQRFGQQYGMLLAGWFSLVSDDPVTIEQAKSIIESFKFSDDKQEATITDEQECLDQILTTRISLSVQDLPQSTPIRLEKSIGEILAENIKGEIESLRDYGILREENNIYIANAHAALYKFVFERTRWSGCWAKTLARLPGAEKSVPKWITGKTTRCVKINLPV
jgi:putative DNA primase/helicase